MVALCLVLAVSVGTTAAVPTQASAAPTSDISTWDTAVVDLPNGGMAYDHVRDQLLVAVSPSVPTLGNRLVELHPRTGAIGRSVVVGATPRAVEVADDGSRAYVGLYDASAVIEVDLATFTVTRRITLPFSQYHGYSYVEDLTIQPGNPEVFATSLRFKGVSPSHAGVAIYDQGVQRPVMTSTHTGATRIEWSDDPSIIYGNYRSFYVLTVDEDGVTLSDHGTLFSGRPDFDLVNGEAIGDNGEVVDTEQLSLSGSYIRSGAVEVDLANDTTYFLSGTELSTHATSTRLMTGSRTVPSVGANSLLDAGATMAASGASQILLLGPGVSNAAFALPSPPRTHVQPWLSRSVALDVEEIDALADGSLVYGVVRQTAAQRPGTVVEVDAATGQVQRELYLGADPHRLAVSDDDSTLLVGHNGATKLTEVSLASFTATREIWLQSGQMAEEIVARPGTSNTFAVVFRSSYPGPIIVEDGAVLPDAMLGPYGPTSIAFTADPDRLYGHNGATTGYDFFTMSVDGAGVQYLSDLGEVLQGFGLELVAAGDLIYASNGGVVDPTVPEELGSVAGSGHPVPIPSEGRFVLVSGSFIYEYSIDSFESVASQAFTGGSTRDAIAAGSNLVIATTSGNLVFVPLGEDPRQIPEVTGYSPVSTASAGGELVTVSGTDFAYATSVEVDGTSVPFEIVDDSTLTFTAPPHPGGDVEVVVTNPIGTSSGGALFAYVAPQPVVSELSPPGGPTAGTNSVIIAGSGFNYATGVSFGAEAAASFTVVSDTRIDAFAPAHPAGSVDVTVTTAGGTSDAVAASDYRFNASVPAVTGVTPNSGVLTGWQTVDISGSGFYGATDVDFGTQPAVSFQIISDTVIRAVTPAQPVGIVSVTVTNANGTSAATPYTTWYAYVEPPPEVESVAPASGPVAGGNMVAIHGDHFDGTIAVRFGTEFATNFVVISDELLVATAPPGAEGEVGIMVVTPHGSNDPATAPYTYGNAPVVTDISDPVGPTVGGELITITGSGFDEVTAVQFGLGTAAPLFTVLSDSEIEVFTPPHAEGVVDVLVSSPVGLSTPSDPATTYTYADVVPGAPTMGSVTRGDGAVEVSWTAPADPGSAAISGYLVTPYLDGVAQAPVTFGSTDTTQTVTGLVNGSVYTFTVAAQNVVGTGAPSAMSAAAIPASVPGAPVVGSATSGDGEVALSWTAPGDDGGSAVTGYVVTPYLDGVAQTPVTFASTVTTQTVTGLVNGSSYAFTVAAQNDVGTSPESAMSESVTPATVPGAPVIGVASAGNGEALVHWLMPGGDGGSPVVAYEVTPYVGGVAQAPVVFDAAVMSQPVAGLANGTAHSFSVVAYNSVGASAPSAESNAVTPSPDAPTASAGPDQAVVKSVGFTLDASGSTDPNDRDLTYTWEQISGGHAVIVDPNQKYAVVDPVDLDEELVFRVTVTNSDGLTHTDTVEVTVGNPK